MKTKKERECRFCGSKTTKIDNGKYEHWYKCFNQWLCHKCYNRLVSQPFQIKFKHKIIHLKKNPHKGICEICGKKTRTHLHHLSYDPNKPLKHTIEVCAKCHKRIHEFYNVFLSSQKIRRDLYEKIREN